MSEKIVVILAGGTGTRLWPLSRKDYPKPFIELNNRSLLETTIRRGSRITNKIFIVTNESYIHLCKDIVSKFNKNLEITYIAEPLQRNTGPAIALAMLTISNLVKKDCDLIVLSADHIILDEKSFATQALDATNFLDDHDLILFGVQPNNAETGYGYIELGKNFYESSHIFKVASFKEKPNEKKALSFFNDGNYLWNSGIFIFRLSKMIGCFKKIAPKLWQAADSLFLGSEFEDSVIRFNKGAFSALENISIDYALVEKLDKVICIKAEFNWSDLGSWNFFADSFQKDDNGNAFVGIDADDLLLNNVLNTFVHKSGFNRKIIAGAGIKDLIIVDSPDALLIMHKDKTNEMSNIIQALKANERKDFFENSYTVRRPWGTYTSLIVEENYQVKRITVNPDSQLSLQYHHQRSEHWIVVRGKALVQVDEEKFETNENEYRYIPITKKHRLTNLLHEELILIEVQFGSYLGEDDIVRLQDDYGRL